MYMAVNTCSMCCHGDVKVSLLSSSCCRRACLSEYDLRWTRYSTEPVLLGSMAFHVTSIPRPPPFSRTVGRPDMSGIPEHGATEIAGQENAGLEIHGQKVQGVENDGHTIEG